MYQSKIRILHIGDLHLEKSFDGYIYLKRQEDLWSTFENALTYAASSDVEIVLISGDLYENENMTLSKLERLAFILSKYKDLNIYIVLGNHDHISEKSNYLKSLLEDHVVLFDNKLEYKEYKYIRIYGFSWDKKEYQQLPFALPSLNENFFNILLLHGTVASMTSYLPINPNLFREIGFDYLALGHIHKPEKVNDFTYYPGSLDVLSAKDQDDHGGILLTVEGKRYQVEFIKFSKNTYKKIDIDLSSLTSTHETLRQCHENLDRLSSDDMIYLNFIGKRKPTIDLEEVQMYLKNYYENIRINDSTTLDIDLEQILLSNKDNIIGQYFTEVLKNYSGEERQMLIKIGLEAFLKEDYLEN